MVYSLWSLLYSLENTDLCFSMQLNLAGPKLPTFVSWTTPQSQLFYLQLGCLLSSMHMCASGVKQWLTNTVYTRNFGLSLSGSLLSRIPLLAFQWLNGRSRLEFCLLVSFLWKFQQTCNVLTSACPLAKSSKKWKTNSMPSLRCQPFLRIIHFPVPSRLFFSSLSPIQRTYVGGSRPVKAYLAKLQEKPL